MATNTQTPVNQVELPLADYDKFLDLQRRVLTCDVDPETARYEMIELLRPYLDHTPEPWETTEISLQRTVSTLNSGR